MSLPGTVRAVSVLVLLLLPFLPAFQVAYGDDTLRPEPIYKIPEDRLPIVLSFNATRITGSDSNTAVVSIIQLSLHENNANTMIENVTFAVRLSSLANDSGTTSDTNSGNTDLEQVFSDVFFTNNGTAKLALAHNDMGETLIENGVREEFLNAWEADANGDGQMLTISSPHINRNGTYFLHVEVLGIDDKRNLLGSEDIPRVDLVLDTANDMSTQVSLVPEFSVAQLVLFASISACLAYSYRFAKKNRT